MKPKVAAVITNYNYGHLVRRAVDSVLAQSCQPDEFIVVDDGSTDDSLQVLAEYAHVAMVISQPNGGQAAAFNTAFLATSADIICLLDADDAWHPNKIERVIALYETDPEAALIFHRLNLVNREGHRAGLSRPESSVPVVLSPYTAMTGGHWPYPPTSGLCLGRAFVRALGKIPENDWRICADSFLAGMAPFFGRVVGTLEPLGDYWLHGNNAFSNSSRSVHNRAFWIKRERELMNHNHNLNVALAKAKKDRQLFLKDVAEYQYARARLWHLDGVLGLLRLALSPRPFTSRSQVARALASAVVKGSLDVLGVADDQRRVT